MSERPLAFVLCALTGIGNAVLARLVAADCAPDLLITRAEQGPYPYEALPFIGAEAARLGVPCAIDTAGEQQVATRGAGLLIAATYHRRIENALIARCAAAINLHPALLPRNRGPNPFFWSIFNGDAETGITAHRLTERMDAGDICLQRSIVIDAEETQSSLRHRLALLAGEVALELVRSHCANRLMYQFAPEAEATVFPRPGETERRLDLAASAARLVRQVNALRDWPLALIGTTKVRRVIEAGPPTAGAAPGTILARDSSTCRFRAADADIVVSLDT